MVDEIMRVIFLCPFIEEKVTRNFGSNFKVWVGVKYALG